METIKRDSNCKNCHISFHKQFGFKNNNDAQFKVFVGMVLA